MRLDLFLVQNGYVSGRNEAKELILGGFVKVCKKIVRKPAEQVEPESDLVTVEHEKCPYVSRGGRKLEAALSAFSLSVSGRVCIDVGASSGGFTDCLLQRNASLVYAVDVGSGQLASSLRHDKRVKVFENYNARNLLPQDFPQTPDLAVMDVSFISQTLILPSLAALLPGGGEIVTLVKPQFESDRKALSKKGIIKTEADRQKAVSRVRECLKELNFSEKGLIVSPIAGGDGNIEYLLYARKAGTQMGTKQLRL